MPIYAYRCESCGHAKDVLQKISDPVLSTCPSCGTPAFKKQLTAAGFQLKGSGWYITDFKNNAGNGAAKPDGGAPDAATSTPATPAGDAATAPAPAAAAPAASAGASDSSAGGCGSSCGCH